jgi:hypothetical protein
LRVLSGLGAGLLLSTSCQFQDTALGMSVGDGLSQGITAGLSLLIQAALLTLARGIAFQSMDCGMAFHAMKWHRDANAGYEGPHDLRSPHALPHPDGGCHCGVHYLRLCPARSGDPPSGPL